MAFKKYMGIVIAFTFIFSSTLAATEAKLDLKNKYTDVVFKKEKNSIEIQELKQKVSNYKASVKEAKKDKNKILVDEFKSDIKLANMRIKVLKLENQVYDKYIIFKEELAKRDEFLIKNSEDFHPSYQRRLQRMKLI